MPVGRTLVLCFDGTGDKFDSTNSNVVRFFSMLAKGDPERQMVYYQVCAGHDSKCASNIDCVRYRLALVHISLDTLDGRFAGQLRGLSI